MHYWASAIEDGLRRTPPTLDDTTDPDPIAALQSAYEQTIAATKEPNWQGTTTACGAQLHFARTAGGGDDSLAPVLYVTNLGDCQVMVVRPDGRKVIYKTKEQWHWFDCPRQLGTNSPDSPTENAVTDAVDLQVGDIVLAMSDGVIDNLWEHEIVDTVIKSVEEWERGTGAKTDGDRAGGRNGGMHVAAQDLVAAAKVVAIDPFAESPYMEHAIDEGLASEGGKFVGLFA